MRIRALVIVAGVLAGGLVVAAPATASSAPDRSTVTVRGSDYGRILFDGRGFALYAFTKDTADRSRCTGACAKAWPPYIVEARPKAGRGATASLLGTIRRGDGRRQVTYAGKPLYYYVGDREPLQVLCQNVEEFGGLWLVVRPTGAPVR
jgi:predicted lipoprotein with Yx(FWY)xxD motif